MSSLTAFHTIFYITLLKKMSEVPLDNTIDSLLEPVPRVGVTDAERELANNAHVEFESKQYDRYEKY